MSINTVEYANQLLAENADLKNQVKELTADLDKESEIRHRIHEELIKLKDKQKLLLVNGSIKTDGFWGRMAAKESVRANKAEARITEQSAVIDQRNSECVRLINEKATLEAKLNEIKVKQQPIGAFHISGGEVEATSDYIEPGNWPVNDGIVEVYAHPAPSVLPPERPANSSNGDDISAWIDEGYNQAIADAKALGAKPMPVIELRHRIANIDLRSPLEVEDIYRHWFLGLMRAADLEVKS